MPDQEPAKIRCADCGTNLKASDTACPNCGSHNRSIHDHDNAKAYEYLKQELKQQGSTRKKSEADYEFQTGEKIGGDGRLVHKKRLLDRDHATSDNSYQEYVKYLDTGEVIVDKNEKLSEHLTKKS